MGQPGVGTESADASPAVERAVSLAAPTDTVVGSGDGGRLDRLTLRFADDGLEQDFRRHFFRNVIGSVRVAFLLGMATWAMWGLMIRQFELDQPDLDVAV